MSIIIQGYDKPKNCFHCPFEYCSMTCTITGGYIDRDDGSCDKPCPITQISDSDAASYVSHAEMK